MSDNLLHSAAISEQADLARSIVSSAPFPVSVYAGKEMRIVLANRQMIEVWGKGDDVIGKLYAEVLPEIGGSGIFEQLEKVYLSGEAYHAINQPSDLVVEGRKQRFFLNYSFTPLFDPSGNVYGVMDTSAKAELSDLNAELLHTQKHLRDVIKQSEQNESRLKNIMREAPVAIGLLRGGELIVEYGNQFIMELWGKTESIFGKPLAEAFPELAGQAFLQILNEVFKTGKPFIAKEARVMLEHEGELKEIFSNFVYQPIQNEHGETTDIIVIAVDVTEQVQSRKKVEHAEEALRLATEAAEVAPWSYHPHTNQWITSAPLRKIFGLNEGHEIPAGAAFALIRDDFKQAVIDAIQASVKNGEPFNIEYAILEAQQGKERWVKSVGKMLYDPHGDEHYLTGALIDITEQKLEVQRKNDFIGMVSHELKTPLTSLSAIIQVLDKKLKTSDDSFLSGAVEKASAQVRRMSAMISGFLNMSRLESGKLILNKEHFDLQQMLLDVCEEFSLISPNHDIRVSTCGPTPVLADRDKIGSVVTNLISNAVKYSPAGSTVSVKCTLLNQTVQVAVTDLGMGISQRDLQKVFDRYYRVESSNTMHISGFGIGLYLSAEIVNLHKGKIWASSEKGKGSIFYFTLPLS